jgi:hypothetical protein
VALSVQDREDTTLKPDDEVRRPDIRGEPKPEAIVTIRLVRRGR